MGKKMLEVKNLKTKYVTRFHEDVYAVDGVSFSIEEGKSLGIAGESGCGKSTLALSMMGYYFPPLHYMSGDIIIDGTNISGMKPDDVRKTILGTEIAYIPQAAMNALNPTQKIIRFVEDVIRAHDPKADKKEIRERAQARDFLAAVQAQDWDGVVKLLNAIEDPAALSTKSKSLYIHCDEHHLLRPPLAADPDVKRFYDRLYGRHGRDHGNWVTWVQCYDPSETHRAPYPRPTFEAFVQTFFDP